jgi:tetratricopeptide (TPR) repeat protein
LDVARRWAAALVVVCLAGCGAAYDTGGVWQAVPLWGSPSDDALAALSKGDFAKAEALAGDAIRQNPQDPYAILALAVVYQNTGRQELARQYYEALVSSRAQAVAMVGLGPSAQRRTVADIAAENLAQLKAQGAGSGRYVEPPTQAALLSVRPPPSVNPGDLGVPEDSNVILRFQTLRRLLDEGLITRDEYNQRRGANLGALLRYTAPPPAADLGRPAPAPERVVDRMRFLVAAYEEKSISAREQMAERTAILDALLPVTAIKRADPPAPVTDQLQAAAVSGRLERLRSANVITGEEIVREKDAVSRAVQTYMAQAEAAARAAAGMVSPPAKPSGPGIRLASYRSEQQALAAWANLQKRYPTQLGALQPVVEKIAERRRGTLYRLSAGPLADGKTAAAVCRALRRQDPSCRPTVLP